MIENVTIVGAGRMGRGIAAVCAHRGCNVIIHDVEEGALEQARQEIKSILGYLLEKELITADQIDSTMSRIKGTSDLEGAVKAADLVIESVPEVMELKKEVFKQLDKYCREDTIMATNTSSLRISELGLATSRPEKVAGVHWVYPPYLIPVVEVIATKQTSKQTISAARDFVLSVGKVPIVCKDVPGFVVNRLQCAVFNEAAHLLEQGVASAEDIDNAARMVMGLRFPFWGPLKVEDMVVTKTTMLAIYEFLHKEINMGKYHPPNLLREMVKKGEQGLTTGKGYYNYKESPAAVARERDDMIITMLKFLAELGYAKFP